MGVVDIGEYIWGFVGCTSGLAGDTAMVDIAGVDVIGIVEGRGIVVGAIV